MVNIQISSLSVTFKFIFLRRHDSNPRPRVYFLTMLTTVLSHPRPKQKRRATAFQLATLGALLVVCPTTKMLDPRLPRLKKSSQRMKVSTISYVCNNQRKCWAYAVAAVVRVSSLWQLSMIEGHIWAFTEDSKSLTNAAASDICKSQVLVSAAD